MVSESNLHNIRDLLKLSCGKNKSKIAFQEKRNGKVVSYTFQQLEEDINALGTQLLSMGLKGKHISILGENSYRWVVSYLAVINGVGVAVPLDKELPEENIAELLKKGDVSVLIFSETFLPCIEKIRERYNGVESYICMSDNNQGYLRLNNLMEEGNNLMSLGNIDYLNAKIDDKGLSIIMFTSGTTGANKGVMLSHANILATVEVATEYFKDYKYIMSVLPLHHVYENVCGMITPINMGATVFFNDSLKYLTNNLEIFKPDMTVMVPLFLETMYKKILIEIKKLKLEKVLKYSIKVSNFLLKFKIDIRPLWYRRIHKIFGGRLKTIVCGGAFLRPELIEGYKELGINVINGYGITECSSLVSVNIGRNLKNNSIGKVVKSNEVEIYDPDESGIGEIMVRGNNVMLGYYKDDISTENSMFDGWFNTGDLGFLDDENNLFLTGRKKNLIVLDNGKNVHPEEIEGYIIEVMPYVQEVIVYTARNNSGTEMIVAAAHIEQEFSNQYNDAEIEKLINNGLVEVNKKLPSFKKVHRIIIKKDEFKKNTSKKIIRDVFFREVVNSGAKS